MNPLMPDAPAQGPQNGLQGAQGAAPGGGGMMASPNPMMPPGPAPGAPTPAPMPTKAQIDEARKHSAVMVTDLAKLTAKPKGELTKKDVFEAASDMISKGAFPTPASRQALVVELAKLPEAEPELRKALGMVLLQASANREQLLAIHGPGDVSPMGGPPSA